MAKLGFTLGIEIWGNKLGRVYLRLAEGRSRGYNTRWANIRKPELSEQCIRTGRAVQSQMLTVW